MKYLKEYKVFESNEINSLNIKETEEYKEGNFWQCIMNMGYSVWQKRDNDIDSDDDMFEYVEKTYGSGFRLMIHLGNYYYQVGNGGHDQYWHNGYASSGSSGFGGNHEDAYVVDWMIENIENSPISRYDSVKKMILILKEFSKSVEDYSPDCQECDGYGNDSGYCNDCSGTGNNTYDCDDCGGSGNDPDDEDESCGNCGGSGETSEECEYCMDGEVENDCGSCDGGSVELYIPGDLDSKLYSLDTLKKDLNNYSKILIDNFFKKQELFKKIND